MRPTVPRPCALGAALALAVGANAAAAQDAGPPPITHAPFVSPEAEDRFDDGATAYWDRRFAEAELAFTEVLEAMPGHSFTHYHRALARWAQGESCPDRALADFDRAIELNPAAWWALSDRGVCHRHRGETAAAIADQSAVLEIDDRLGRAYVRRAYVHSQAGDLDAALDDLDAAVARGAHMKEFWLTEALVDRGEIHRVRGETEAARSDYERALEIDPLKTRAEAGLALLAEE